MQRTNFVNRGPAIFGLAGIIAAAVAPQLRGESFVDNFEAPTFDSYWTVSHESGSTTLSSTAHTGDQSAALSAFAGQNGGGGLHQFFATPMRGYASVWVYDTAPGQQTRYCHLTLYNTEIPYSQPGNNFWVGFEDHTPSYYTVINPATGMSVNTAVPRSVGWHHFEIVINDNGGEYRIDGATVYTFKGVYQFDQISLEVYGPSWRPSATFYFDDLVLVTTPVVDCTPRVFGDIAPCGGDGLVNLDDILAVLAAFSGSSSCPDDCVVPQ